MENEINNPMMKGVHSRRFRASSLPMAFKCGGSVHLDDGSLRVEPVCEPATLGTVVHEVLAEVVSKGLDELPELLPFAERHDLEAQIDELAMLARFGLQAWKELRGMIAPDAFVEAEPAIESDRLTGHIDVLAQWSTGRELVINDACLIVDWKSGRLDADHYNQMAAYAWLSNQCGVFDTVTVVVVLLRDRAYRTYRFTAETLERWYAGFLAGVVNWDGTFHPGEHCRFCPRAMTCPARTALIRSALNDLHVGIPALTPENRAELAVRLVDLYRRLKVVKGAIDSFDDQLRTEIETGGPLPTGDGGMLSLVVSHRDNIDPLKSWPVMDAEGLTGEEIAPAVKIGKTKLLEAVAAKHAKGMKGKAKAAFMEAMERAGAVTQTENKTLREVRGEEKQLTEE